MKYKASRNAILNCYSNVKKAGAGDLQCLLKFHRPVAYASGMYGWNYDVYDVYGIAICTGYRNMPGERLQGIEEYETKAHSILCNMDGWEEQKEAIEILLKEFCKLNGGVDYEII